MTSVKNLRRAFPQAKKEDAEALLEAFTSRRFSAASLERTVANEPDILSRLEPAGAAEILDVLAKACFLPNRVRGWSHVYARFLVSELLSIEQCEAATCGRCWQQQQRMLPCMCSTFSTAPRSIFGSL